MESWKIYAFAAAIFAGFTSVLAKSGLKTLPSDIGLAVRTSVVFLFVILNVLLWHGAGESVHALAHAGRRAFILLALSGLTTTISWVCYYRAMATGTVTFVSLVDKGSIVVTLLLSTLVLGEAVTWKIGLGASLVLAGLVVLVWK